MMKFLFRLVIKLCFCTFSTNLGQAAKFKLVTAKSICEKEPISITDTFTNLEKHIFAHLCVQTKSQRNVSFEWLFNGKIVSKWDTVIKPSLGFRTFSKVKPKIGKWFIKVFDADNKELLASKEFEVRDPKVITKIHNIFSKNQSMMRAHSAKTISEALASLNP